jgi:hypothetical protein
MNTAVPTPSGRITMKNVPHPVLGFSNAGDMRMMYPGSEHQFDGNMVYEIPYTNIPTLPQHINLNLPQMGPERSRPFVDFVGSGSADAYNMFGYGYLPIADGLGISGNLGKWREGDWKGTNYGVSANMTIPINRGKSLTKYQKGKETSTPENPTPLPEITITPNSRKRLKEEEDYTNNRISFIQNKMQDYVKSQGNWGKAAGLSMSNFPQEVMENYGKEFDYLQNTKAVENLAKQKGWNLEDRDTYVDKLTLEQAQLMSGSKYGKYLQPDIPTRTRAGARALVNTVLPGQPVSYNIPGLSPNEQKEYSESALSAFNMFAPIDYLGTTPANYAKNRGLSTGSDYAELPSFGSGQKMGNVTDLDVMALNPVNYVDAAALIKSMPTIARTIGTVSKSGYNTAAKGFQRVADVFGDRPQPVDMTDEVVRRVMAKLDARDAVRQLPTLENPQQLTFDFGNVTDQYRASNQLPPPPSEIEIPTQLISNASRASRRTRRYPDLQAWQIENLPPSPENLFDIEDLRRAYWNSTRFLSPEEYSYLNNVGLGDPKVYEGMNDRVLRNFREQRRVEIESQPPELRNKSRMTMENAMNSANEAAKDKLLKMSDDEFKQTVVTTKGDVVPYYEESLENYFTGPNNVTAISPEQYANLFNQNLNRLNEIIAGKNTSGVQYRVKELTPGGNLIFETPDQIVNGKNIASGTQQWGVSINPGKWSGEVADIANKEYFRSIPGLEMSASGSGIFPYREELAGMKLSGTRAYESINDYLKELGLGRVKPGFNSQTSSTLNDAGERIMSGSMDVWKNFIDKGKAVGYYGSPYRAIHGVMRQVGGDMEMGLPNTGVNFEDIPDDVLAIMIANNRLK